MGFYPRLLRELRDHTARCGQPLCIRTGSVTDVLSKLAERYEILAITLIRKQETAGLMLGISRSLTGAVPDISPYVTIRLTV